MKKLLLFLLLSISVLFVSCDSDSNVYPEQANNHPNLSANPATWQEQVEYAKNNSTLITKAGSAERVCLQGYTYKGTIKTEAERSALLEDLFSDNSITVQCSGISHVEFVTIKDIKQRAKAQGVPNPSVKLKSQLDTIIQVGMELIELEWSYKGDTFYSIAIASNDRGGIIYDHIGHLIPSSVNVGPDIETNAPVLKTKSEGGSQAGPVILRFTKPGSVKNALGVLVASWYLTCSSYFNDTDILIDRQLHSSSSHASGWDCEADIRTVSGELYSSQYHEFAWGYTYGSNMTVQIGWNGNGFSFSGGGVSNGSTEIHRP